MKTSLLRRTLSFGLLPALLTLASCGGSSNDPAPTPAPDQGRVLFVHAASNINTVALKFSVDNAEKTPALTYGQSSGYQSLMAGSRAVQVTAGTQVAASQTITVEKNKSYSFFATPSTSSSSVNSLLVPDDATLPANGKARIRIVNLSQNISAAIKLSQITTGPNGPVVQDVVTGVAANTASAYIDFTPSIYNLSILDAANNKLADVGDGGGAGTGTKKYEEARLYTVVVTGTAGSLIPEQQIRVFVSQNN